MKNNSKFTNALKDEFISERIVFGEGFAHDHDPPIGFGRGSAFVEFADHVNFKRENPPYTHGRFEYTITPDPTTTENYIGGVAILTEEDNSRGTVEFRRATFPAGLKNAVVNLWVTSARNDSKDETPDIVVTGGKEIVISCTKPLSKANKPWKGARGKRFDFGKALGSISHWEVTDGTNILKDANGNLKGDNDDMYWLWLTINHN
ncbi:MAG: hypothetical protein ACK5NT_01875 [Pyrinomonadaceae bacterium]